MEGAFRDGQKDAAKGTLLAANPYRHISYDLAMEWERGWCEYHATRQEGVTEVPE